MRFETERLTERCAAYKGQVEAGAAEIDRLRAANAELLEACQVMLTQLEDAMAGEINEQGQRWVTGKTDLELRRDGSYMLSRVRAVVAKANAY